MDEPKFALIGISEEIYDETYEGLDVREKREIVALFSSEKRAKEYAEASKLKSYSDFYSWRDSGRQFRANSLLCYCVSYEIEAWLGLPPVDPEPPTNKKTKKG